MRLVIFSILFALLCVPATAAGMGYECLHPPVELRAIWVDADSIPKTVEGVKALVREYHRLNFNVLLPEVICRGYTVYPSKLLARDPRFTGAPDPLAPLISEAHRMGMEVHPWVWVFRAGYTGSRGAILTAHPDWVERDRDGEELSQNGGFWISPVIPQARDFLASLFAELVTNYEVDGLNLDYIRYEVQSHDPFGYCDAARKEFERLYGIDPVNIEALSIQQLEWEQFRERQVSTFVHQIALQTRAIRPKAMVSASVGYDPVASRTDLMQDWVNWVDNKWVDFLLPMTYTTENAGFAFFVGGQLNAVHNKTILAPGIGMYAQADPVGQTMRQVGITRELRVGGQALFSEQYFGQGQKSALEAGPYARPAAVPFRMPLAKSLMLREAAKRTTNSAAEYYTDCAKRLSDYESYRESRTGYVSPTRPPIYIPPSVIPLPTVEIPLTSRPILIDGQLGDEAWQSAARVELRYTVNGDPASEPTQALIIRDADNLYIAFRCAEPHIEKIKAAATRRDDPTFYDDSVEVFLQPPGKHGAYFHYSVNTIGTRFDQRILDPHWNGDWSATAKIGKDEWTAEIAIPFASLHVPQTPAPGQFWRLNLARNRTAGGAMEHFTWAVPYGSLHSPERFGKAVFK